jgi:hypothetical protein
LHDGKNVFSAASLGLALACAGAAAQDRAPQFSPEQIKKGADLRTFPRDARVRFVDSVTHGKRNMPSWDDVLKPGDVDALWAYVVAGEPGN